MNPRRKIIERVHDAALVRRSVLVLARAAVSEQEVAEIATSGQY